MSGRAKATPNPSNERTPYGMLGMPRVALMANVYAS